MGGVYSTTSYRLHVQTERKDERPHIHMETPALALLTYAYIYSLNSIEFSLADFS